MQKVVTAVLQNTDEFATLQTFRIQLQFSHLKTGQRIRWSAGATGAGPRVDNSPVAHMWRAMIRPAKYL